jgi:RimJ/RimL family protein N-acetyltransferase
MTAAPLLPEIKLDLHAPAEEARAFLERDRILAAYALADIDQPDIEGSRWWAARRDGELQAVVLVVEGLPFRPCFATGSPDALSLIFREAIREPRLLLATPPRCRIAVETTYRFERVDQMLRMVVNISSFRPRVAHRVTRLGPEDLDAVIDLYGHASRTYFTPERMRREIYFGVYQGGALVSAAGTHVRSERASIAAVGNVLTRLAYRGRGMATSCTSAVTAAALEEHRDVVLNVRHDNAPAIAVYERLGYVTHGTFLEGPAVRRAPWERLFGALKEKKS